MGLVPHTPFEIAWCMTKQLKVLCLQEIQVSSMINIKEG